MDKHFIEDFDFKNFRVRMTENSLEYFVNNTVEGFRSILVPSHFENRIDSAEDGGGIFINYTDRWGSKMSFTHYQPSDLKGMFEFIAAGYKITL